MKRRIIALLMVITVLLSVSPGTFYTDTIIAKDPDLGELDRDLSTQ